MKMNSNPKNGSLFSLKKQYNMIPSGKKKIVVQGNIGRL